MKPTSIKSTWFSVITVVSVATYLISCSYFKDNPDTIEFEQVTVRDTFSMDIPVNMKEASNLNEEAVLQYSNLLKEIYVVVIKENKKQFIDAFLNIDQYDTTQTAVVNYRTVQLNIMSGAIDIQNQTEPKAFKIGKLRAQQVNFDGKVEGVKYDIAYFITFVEGRHDLYMIMAWTLKDRKEKYRGMFDKIAKSFKELKLE